ncbi:TetR family transcriptional regulator [Streptococcus canis]|uniref:TetR family transcriptional regulator n=1 Tax=Streptococcus canis TaxID=1329 RepID=UPI00299504AF|nr:TetR family transcriptional regulator [Streptococcus canis]
MTYFEQRFQHIYDNFLFSLRIYHHHPKQCKACYQDCLKQMDSLFSRHDTHDRFSKQLLDCKNAFQKKARLAYFSY